MFQQNYKKEDALKAFNELLESLELLKLDSPIEKKEVWTQALFQCLDKYIGDADFHRMRNSVCFKKAFDVLLARQIITDAIDFIDLNYTSKPKD